MDIHTLQYPSMCLSKTLDRIIGTDEVVILRRTIDAVTYYVSDKVHNYKLLYSGSKGEGLNFDSSDEDIMAIDCQTEVKNSLNDRLANVDKSNDLLLMRRDGCNPGFVILQSLRPAQHSHIWYSLVDYFGIPVVSSLLFRDFNILPLNGSIGHGPCTTYNAGCTDIDIAFCFKCRIWPTEARKFIHRSRSYGWPSDNLITQIISTGCHLVAVGDKASDIAHIQWRISFSAAEKALVHSFNHTQLKVYGLLKIFLKQVIDVHEDAKDLLCSYFMKTVLFYSIESTPGTFWREDLLIPCFWFCLSKLKIWVQRGFCPNFFIPENNMFRNKVHGESRRNLLRVLIKIKNNGWKSLYQCSFLRSLENVIENPCQAAIENLGMSETEKELTMDQTIFQKVKDYSHLIWHNRQISPTMVRCLMLLRNSKTQTEEDISSNVISGVLASSALLDFTNVCLQSDGLTNKRRYGLMKKTERLLFPYLDTNTSSGYLTLATFYLKTGQYNKVIRTCKHMISKWKPFVAYHSKMKIHPFNLTYIEHICGRGFGIREKMKRAFARDFMVCKHHPNEILFPKELKHDLDEAMASIMAIPPLPYGVFLMFLSYHNLGDIDSSLSALHDLRALVHDKQQGCQSNHIVLNLLAICLEKIGDHYGAIEACLDSQNLSPNNNGAYKLLSSFTTS